MQHVESARSRTREQDGQHTRRPWNAPQAIKAKDGHEPLSPRRAIKPQPPIESRIEEDEEPERWDGMS